MPGAVPGDHTACPTDPRPTPQEGTHSTVSGAEIVSKLQRLVCRGSIVGGRLYKTLCGQQQ